ncbi:MAG: hypothetical protein WC997_00500 [Porticoccaceae bacterium]
MATTRPAVSGDSNTSRTALSDPTAFRDTGIAIGATTMAATATGGRSGGTEPALRQVRQANNAANITTTVATAIKAAHGRRGANPRSSGRTGDDGLLMVDFQVC